MDEPILENLSDHDLVVLADKIEQILLSREASPQDQEACNFFSPCSIFDNRNMPKFFH